jgi:hypothetical protein
MRSVTPLLLLAIGCGDPVKPVLSDELLGSCSYVNRFSDGPECRDYLGDWTLEEAEADCERQRSTFLPGQPCEVEEVLGYCLLDDNGQQLRVHVEGDDATQCKSNKTGCQFFANGYWDPAPICAGGAADELIVLENVFPQPQQVCVEPLAGEPPGQSPGGLVCTWEMISGATEEGRAFSDYASCDPVRAQRGYSPVPSNPRYAEPDPRMDDPVYVAELDWVRGQIRSAGCICCHDNNAPDGPSVFDVDATGNMMNQFNDAGLAMGAGWINTVSFGAYPPEQNNGFERADLDHPGHSIFPTTDMDRMLAFFRSELAHRGKTEADFADYGYAAGPLDTLRAFKPGACLPGEGVGADGILRWQPGRARYVYVLEADTVTPTVPPNLDIPDGTLWRLDLAEGAYPVASDSIRYGEVPSTMVQRFPAEGAPAPLKSGELYYLYVTADVLFPISRCLFVAP